MLRAVALPLLLGVGVLASPLSTDEAISASKSKRYATKYYRCDDSIRPRIFKDEDTCEERSRGLAALNVPGSRGVPGSPPGGPPPGSPPPGSPLGSPARRP